MDEKKTQTAASPGSDFSVEIQPEFPERFSRLGELANDLYFSWNRAVRGFFRHLDEACWNACAHNPKVFLRRVRQNRLDAAARDPILLTEYRNVLSAYDTYLEEQPVTPISQYLSRDSDRVAYFSAEFGFHESIPIYAGGLGILAGDYCKAMSNLWVPFTGVGLLYRQGYFTQRIDCNGAQVADYPYTDPGDLPVSPASDAAGNELRVRVSLPGRQLVLKVWQVRVGKIELYLLDSDVQENSSADRDITAQLYGGDGALRLQQEIVLGFGGVKALRALGIHPTVWHINEGHAAFLILERCREQVASGRDFETALELVAANTVFTTHTPVAAGHDVFSTDEIQNAFSDLLAVLEIPAERLFALGSVPDTPRSFSMTSLALRGARYMNGVSRVHGDVAADMCRYVWPDIPAGENPMRYVTNGADVDSYLALSWVALFEMYMGGGWRAKLTDTDFWQVFIDDIPNHVFLSVRHILKVAMLEEVGRRAMVQYRRCASTRSIAERLTRFLDCRSAGTLVIGFARRFATYKRANLLFSDLDRLARLVNDPERPVICIFAGKAHPNDGPGQQLLKQIYDVSLRPEFQGKVILLEDYNLSLARDLLPGVDIWLNNPEYPLEACGTSGMKAAINGVVNLSVLDGWWDEAYDGTNGWAITPYPDMDPALRRHNEAVELLNILEYQVIPAYYERNSEGESSAWVARCKASMKSVLPRFNTIRMARDYLSGFYAPAARGGRRLRDNNASDAGRLARWKQKVADNWHGLQARLASPVKRAIGSSETLPLDVEVMVNGLDAEDIVVECIIGTENAMGEFTPAQTVQFDCTGAQQNGNVVFHCELFETEELCSAGGLQHFRIRVYPWHELLSHRFECGRLLWL